MRQGKTFSLRIKHSLNLTTFGQSIFLFVVFAVGPCTRPSRAGHRALTGQCQVRAASFSPCLCWGWRVGASFFCSPPILAIFSPNPPKPQPLRSQSPNPSCPAPAMAAPRAAKRPKFAPGAAPPQRGEDDYVPGNIVEIELFNFMTYDHLVCCPGPRLNLVVGPNGSGKSSLVCAIALGLAGDPNVRARLP